MQVYIHAGIYLEVYIYIYMQVYVYIYMHKSPNSKEIYNYNIYINQWNINQ